MVKKLVIKNELDVKKFYNKLFLYKSFMYRFVYFKLVDDKYNISSIVNALNIKNRRKRVEFIYNSACDELDFFYKDKNMCDFKNNQCCVQRKLDNNKFNGCCRMCMHQSNNGCRTKNLTCKLFFCSEVRQKHKVLTIEDIKVLKVLGVRQRYILKNNYFSSKKEVINDLYLGSILLVMFRYVYRIVRNFFRRMFRRVW